MKKIAHALICLIAIIGLIVLASGDSYAADVVASGTCGANGDNLTWTLDSEGVLTISGEGAMEEYDIGNNTPWYPYRSSIKELTIDVGVTSIGSYAFYNCTDLTRINYNAITVSDLTASSNAFYNAGKLETGIAVTIGDLVEKIPAYLFYVNNDDYTPNIQTVTMGNLVASIGSSAFRSCSSLTSLIISDSVTSIGSFAFYYCTGLTSVTMGNGIMSIGDFAFSGCSSLTSITIPEGVTSIGYTAFNCSHLTEINYNAISANDLISTSWVFINAGKLGPGIAVTFGDQVEKIPAYLFYVSNSDSTPNINSITIGNNVISIGSYAFYNCSGLTNITIPDSVMSIGDAAFYNCTNLTEVNFNAKTVSDLTDSSDVFYNAGTSGTGITVTFGDQVEKIPAYLFYVNSNHPNIKVVIIGSRVTSIGNYAFYYCDGLTSITIPDSVIIIGNGAFYFCSALTSITIPDNVTSIGGSAFSNCIGLSNLTLGNSLTSIGGGAFYGCTGLTSITIPESVASIGRSAFYGCVCLTEINYNAVSVDSISYSGIFYNAGTSGTGITVTFGDQVEKIPAYLFYVSNNNYAPNIKVVTIGNSVSSIGDSAFYGCSYLSEINYNAISVSDLTASSNVFYNAGTSGTGITVTFGDQVEKIPAYLFYMSYMKVVTIGNSVSSIGDSAFYGCSYLSEINYNAISVSDLTASSNVFYNAGTSGTGITVTFGDQVEKIPAYLFYMSYIKVVTIGNSVTSIGSCAFNYCTGLINITIPASVTSIGSFAFKDCTSLASLTIGEGVTVIGSGAFYWCTRLTEINYNARNAVASSSDDFENAGSFDNGIIVRIGPSVETIPAPLVNNVKSLVFDVDADNLFYKSIDGILYNKTGKQLVRCPKLIDGAVIIPSSVKAIGNDAFSGCTRLTNITIPESVINIGSNAFYNCTGLTSITIPGSVISIGEYAFSGCTGLEEVNYNAINVSSTNYYVFENAGTAGEGITLVFGDSVETIPEGLFYGCTGLTSITIPESVTSIGGSAFYNCTGLTEINYNASNATASNGGSSFYNAGRSANGIIVTFGDSVEEIPDYLFYAPNAAPNLKTVNIGMNVTRIGDYAFDNCKSLTSIEIPQSVVSIGSYAFGDCLGLKSVTIPESVSQIDSGAFYHCSGLTEINYYARAVSSSNSYVFYGAGTSASGIKVTFGETVESIPAKLFYASTSFYRPNIVSVTFLGDKPTYGNNSFYNNTFYGYYPFGNSTWNILPSLGTGNNITWYAYSLGVPVSAEVAQMPYNTVYEKGSALDISGLSLDVTFSDGCVERHELSDLEIISYDLNAPGRRPVTVAYREVQTTFYVTVYEYVETVIDSSLYPESPHPYENDMDQTYSFSQPGATKIVFTFSEDTFVEDIVDKLYVYDNYGSLVAEYTRNEAAGETITIYGDSFSIRLTSDESYTEYGFSLSSIVVTTKVGTCENGHTFYEDVSYVWEEDYSVVSACYMCCYCEELQVVETVQTTMVCTATCTESGISTYTAVFTNSDFGTQTKSVETSALGHDLIHHDAQAPTCTEIGWAEYDTCSRCNHTTYVEQPALGHDLIHHAAQAPTCTEIGWDEYDTCSRCDHTTYVEQPALGHDLIHHAAQAPTCTEIGWDEYDTCSRCDHTTYIEQPALGHDWGDPVFTWTDDYTGAIATRTCLRDTDHTETKPATVTVSEESGEYAAYTVYTAAATFDDTPYSDVVRIKNSQWAKLKAANLTLEGKITINFKVGAPDEGYVAKFYYEKNDYALVKEIPLTNAIWHSDSTGEYYLVSFDEVPAKEMSEKLRIKVFDAEGNQVYLKTTSAIHDYYDYSVATWCNNRIAKSSDPKEVELAKALLNYGHYSQFALKYKDGRDGRPNKLANPNGYLASEMNGVTANTAYSAEVNNGKDLGAKAFALVLESNTSIKLKLKRQVTVTINGTAATLYPETENDGTAIWAVYKDDIAAKKLHERQTFKLTEGGNSATMYYGALSWANSKLNGSNVDEKNLAKAMYLYNYAARKYFNYDAAGL